MKVFYNSKLAKILTFISDFKTMMFCGFIITEESNLSDRTINHEKIHIVQYTDYFMLGSFMALVLLFIFFGLEIITYYLFLLLLIPILLYYIVYGIEYIIRLIQYKTNDLAYENISFEREAYDKENDPCYIGVRRSFSNFKYIKYGICKHKS